MPTKALELVDKITNDEDRSVALARVAIAYADAGIENAARKTLDRAIRAAANKYRSDNALKAAADIHPHFLDSPEIQSLIAKAQIKLGDTSQAMDALTSLSLHHADYLDDIALLLKGKKDFQRLGELFVACAYTHSSFHAVNLMIDLFPDQEAAVLTRVTRIISGNHDSHSI
jgi:tetratricopeptide (TPR) repeat protein